MNRTELRQLQSIYGYPALSILAPMHRSAPENRQDPIRVKNLVKQATDRLRREYSRREIGSLLDRLGMLTDAVDYRHAMEGLALYVARGFAQAYHLPFPVKERVVIDATFATRDLVAGIHRSVRYWVLLLSEKTVRLFSGMRGSLAEMSVKPFPLVDQESGPREHGHGDFTVEKSSKSDERHRRFYRQADAALAAVLAREPMPVFLIGGQRPMAHYHDAAKQSNHLAGTILGAYDKAVPADLARLVHPLVDAYEAEQRRQALLELDAAIHHRKYASGMQEAWTSALEGRGSLLLVESGFFYPARLDSEGRELTPAADPTAPGVIDDAVDELIESVISKGGRVVFLPDGSLPEHSRVALVLRY